MSESGVHYEYCTYIAPYDLLSAMSMEDVVTKSCHPVLDSTPPWQTRLVNDWFLSANCVTNLDTWSPCLMLESNSLYFASSILIFWKYFHEWQEYKRWVQNTESFYFEVEKFCYCHLLVLWICKVCSWARSKMCLENPSILFRTGPLGRIRKAEL